MAQVEVTKEDETTLRVGDATIDAGDKIIDHLVHEGQVYIVTNFDDNTQNLYCYDLDGNHLWTAPDAADQLDNDAYTAIHLSDDKSINTSTFFGYILIVDPETGEMTFKDRGK